MAVFRTRNDYMGVNNPPVLIPPYGGRGRGGAKRARPRIARNVVSGPPPPPQPPQPTLVTPPAPHAIQPPVPGPVIGDAASHLHGSAPIIAPSKGGRPPGRARGPRRRSAVSASQLKSTGTLLEGGGLGEEEERGVAVLLSAYDRRYAELLEKPLAGEASARTLPVTLHPNSANLPASSAAPGPRGRVLAPGSARTRGKLSPFRAPLASPPLQPAPPTTTPPKASSSGTGPICTHGQDSNLNRFPEVDSKDLEPAGFEGLIVAQVVEELREERMEAARAKAAAAAAKAAPPAPSQLKEPPSAAAPQQLNGAKTPTPLSPVVVKEESVKSPAAAGRDGGKSGAEASTETESETGEAEEAGAGTSETDTDSEGEWRDEDYITRCICGLQHNDEFMICCDNCDAWQHCRCMGIGRPPDTYLCERCDPRVLRITPAKARQFQTRKLQERAKEKERKKAAKKAKSRKSKPKAAGQGKPPFEAVAASEFSPEAAAYVRTLDDTGNADLLERLAGDATAVMFVAPEKEGLVATRPIPLTQPAAEFRGRVGLPAQVKARDKAGRLLPFILSVAELGLLVDARRRGSDARFVRRSCKPNTRVVCVVSAGSARFLLLPTQPVDRGTELTIPWDWDFTNSRLPLECACAQDIQTFLPSPEKARAPPCPIAAFNADLNSSPQK